MGVGAGYEDDLLPHLPEEPHEYVCRHIGSQVGNMAWTVDVGETTSNQDVIIPGVLVLLYVILVEFRTPLHITGSSYIINFYRLNN